MNGASCFGDEQRKRNEKTSMQILIAEDYEELSRLGAKEVSRNIAERPGATLLVATGNTPMGVYQDLAHRREAGMLDTASLSVFQLDEYIGLEQDDRRSLYGWTRRSFVDPLRIPLDQVTRLDATASDIHGACSAYDAKIQAAGGIDLAILGLGPNGHLGFNEPPSQPDAPTRIVDLTEESVASNAQYWGSRDLVPRQAMTAGMNVVLASRHTLLLVSGSHKRNILKQTVYGEVTSQIPSSYLQRASNVTIIADRQAWGNGELAGADVS
jgi:glucosamine-6-phosphate deaminase